MSKYNGLDPYEEIARTLYQNGEKSILRFIRELPETILEHYFEWAFEQEKKAKTWGHSGGRAMKTLPTNEVYHMYSVGNNCRVCDKGVYEEMSLMDSFNGRLTCNHCSVVVYVGEKYYE